MIIDDDVSRREPQPFTGKALAVETPRPAATTTMTARVEAIGENLSFT